MKLIFVLDCSERCRRDQEAFGDREGRLGEAAGRRREHDEEPLKTQNFTQHSGTSHRSTDIVKKCSQLYCMFIHTILKYKTLLLPPPMGICDRYKSQGRLQSYHLGISPYIQIETHALHKGSFEK
jgi:hypothetical protein